MEEKKINKCDGKMCARCCYNCDWGDPHISYNGYHCELYDEEVDAEDTCDNWK